MARAPAMARNGKVVASIASVCANAWTKSATACNMRRHGSAIKWAPGFMQFVSGYATNVGATGEKTSRSSTSCLLGLRWITVTVHSIRSQVNWVDFHRNPHRNTAGKGFAVAQSAIDLNLID